MGGALASLVIPYLLYQVIYLPIALYNYRDGLDDIICWLKIITGIVIGDGYETPISLPVNIPCWFIVSIIQLRLLFIFIPINKSTSFLLSSFSILSLVLLDAFNIDFYFCLDSTLMAIPYFIFGHYIAEARIIDKQKNDLKRFLFFVLGLTIVGIVFKYNGEAQMNGPSFGKNILINYVAGVAGSYAIFMLSAIFADIFKERKLIYDISRNTLFIIFFHFFLLAFIGKIIDVGLTQINIHLNSFAVLVATFLLSVTILYFSKLIMVTISKWGNKYFILFGKKQNKI